MTVFVDSSFWIAQALPRDGLHHAAVAGARSHDAVGLVTSNLVVGETWTHLRSRGSHGLAWRWLDGARSLDALTVVRVDEEIETEAWSWLRRHDERPYSFVDATSFVLMRRHRVTSALTFDGDFAAAGFTVVGRD